MIKRRAWKSVPETVPKNGSTFSLPSSHPHRTFREWFLNWPVRRIAPRYSNFISIYILSENDVLHAHVVSTWFVDTNFSVTALIRSNLSFSVCSIRVAIWISLDFKSISFLRGFFFANVVYFRLQRASR